MDSLLDHSLQSLVQEGQHESTDQFTIDPAAAWRRVRTSQIHIGERYAGYLVAAAVSHGAERVEVQLEKSHARIHLCGWKPTVEQLEKILSNPIRDSIMLGLLGAQHCYPRRTQICVACSGGSFIICGDKLRRGQGQDSQGVLIDIVAPRRFWGGGRLNHQAVSRHLEEDCRYCPIPVQIDGRSLTLPVDMGRCLTLIQVVHPNIKLPEYTAQATEEVEVASPGNFCALIGCLGSLDQILISNGRLLVQARKSQVSAVVFLEQAALDLSGELIERGQAYLDFVADQVDQTMIGWATRDDLPQEFGKSALEAWKNLCATQGDACPIYDQLSFRSTSDRVHGLREVETLVERYGLHLYPTVEPRLRGPFMVSHPLLQAWFPGHQRMTNLPEGVTVTVATSDEIPRPYHSQNMPDGGWLGIDSHGPGIKLFLDRPRDYNAALKLSHALPPGSQWLVRDLTTADQWLPNAVAAIMRKLARDPANLCLMLGYLAHVAKLYQRALLPLEDGNGEHPSSGRLPMPPLDALCRLSQPLMQGNLRAQNGLPRSLSELAQDFCLPTPEGERVSLQSLLYCPKVWVNQPGPGAVQIPPEYTNCFYQFIGSIRRPSP